MLRLMFLGDRIVGGTSAYSKVGYEVCTRLARMGHSVAHIPMSRSNRMGKWVHQGILIYPSGLDPWGEDVAAAHYADYRADMLITLKEPWVFQGLHRYALNFCPHAIIDHSPVSASITARLHSAFKVIAVSRFGQRELRKANIESTYIPHGVRTDLYRPLEGRKAACKRMFFLDPDEFVVGVVAMNRSRKMLPRMLQGYKRFLELNPDVKTHLMLWTDIQGGDPSRSEEGGISLGVSDVGVNLMPEILELNLGEPVRWPDRELIREGLPEWAGENWKAGWDMVKLYNAFDCLLLCSGGEGFGLPLIEAQSCGVGVVTTDYAAGPEQVGAGVNVKADGYVVLNTPGTRYALASIDGMAEALGRILNSDRAKLARRARSFAERYSWENVMTQYWQPFLDICEGELKPRVTVKGIATWR